MKTITCISFNHIQFFLLMNQHVFTIDDIRILVEVVIANPTQTYLLPWFYSIKRFLAFNATQAKENNYHNRHPTKQFLLLTIEVYGGLHKRSMCFYMIMPMPFRAYKGQKAFIFLP